MRGRLEGRRRQLAAESRDNGVVKDTRSCARLVRMVSLCVFMGLVVLACASEPPGPVDESVLLPLPAGYEIVHDSAGFIFECEAESCSRRWTVRAEDPSRDDHPETLAAHVGSKLQEELRLVEHPTHDPRYIFSSDDLWVQVLQLEPGLIRISVNSS